MAKKANYRLMAVVILAVLTFSVSAFARLYDGGGTEADPFIIDSAAKMNDIGNNQGDWGGYFKLIADIDLGGYTGTMYDIIGNAGAPFKGVFDGNDHSISNFNYAYNGSNDYIALFGYIDHADAAIKNLNVVDANIFVESSDCEYIGSIAGRLRRGRIVNCRVLNVNVDAKLSDFVGGLGGCSDFESYLDNCYVSGSITGSSAVGGLLGETYGILNDCHTSIAVTAGYYSGGLVSLAHNPIITNCSSAGSVFNTKNISYDGEDTTYCGGLIAESYSAYGNPRDSVIENCHSSCELSTDSTDGEDSALYGGLIGVSFSDITIINCSASGNVSGGELVGGLAGAIYGSKVENCHTTGDVNGVENVGGLVGDNENDLIRSYSTGNVTGEENVGGLVGRNDLGNIYECFSTGDVTGAEHIGGLVGENNGWIKYEEGGNISNSYSRGNVTGQTSVGGLVGYQDEGNVFYSYSTGFVDGNSDVGGLVGGGEQWEVTSSFWDVNTSGQITSVGGTGKTTAEMYDSNTFIVAGWDFNTPIWKVSDVPDYPYLWWEGPMVSSLGPEDNSLITKSSVDIYVTFNRSVVGVGANDMLLSGDASVGANVGTSVHLGGNTWQFPITGLVDGTLDISLASEPNGIEDANGNDLQPRPTRWSYNVFVLTPVLQAEPEVTLGTDNLISWGEVNNAEMYYAQCSNEPNFVSILSNSDWIYDTEFDFGNLNIGQTYWYRAKAKTVSGVVAWLQTSQEDFERNIINKVNTESEPGDIILVRGQQTQYSSNYVGDFDQRTDSEYAATIVNYFKFKYDCELTNIRHYVDPGAGVNEFVFSVYEASSKTGTYHRIHKNSVPVTARVWNWYSSGTISVPIKKSKYYAMGIGCSRGFSFRHNTRNTDWLSWGQKIGARDYYSSSPSWLPAISGPFVSNKTYHQRFSLKRIVDIGYIPGNIVSTTIELPVGGNWVDLNFTATLPSNTNLSIDVLDGLDDSVIIEDANSGFDLSEITAASIKLRANLSTGNSNVTPALHDWSITYTDPTTIIESDWSNVVWSMQGTLGDAVEVMLDPNSLKNANMANALGNKIDEVLAMIDAGLYTDALKKLENDILKKTDGCSNSGEPDKNDWIETCEQQEQIYPLIMETIEYVRSLME